MQTNPRPFLLERYFGIHEFTAKVLLSSSDVESLSVREVLEMSAGDAEAMALWNDLSLGYTESQGHPLLLREIAATYGPNIDASHILEIAPEEGIFIAMSAIVAAGDNVVVTWPAYQSLFEVAQARGATIRKWNAVDGRRFDLDDLDAQIAACGGSVKLIIVNFPHNPTGATLTVDEQARLVETAKRAGAFSSPTKCIEASNTATRRRCRRRASSTKKPSRSPDCRRRTRVPAFASAGSRAATLRSTRRCAT